MKWLLKRGWMYAAMVAISVFALFPVAPPRLLTSPPRAGAVTRGGQWLTQIGTL